MNIIAGKESGLDIINVGLEPGELLLESINKVIEEYDIQNGAILTGYGTLDKCHLHYVKDDKYPPTNIYYTLEKAFELISINGIIANKMPHIHVMVSCGETKTYGGHLENGTRVLYLSELSIIKFNNIRMTREFDKEREISLLKKENPSFA